MSWTFARLTTQSLVLLLGVFVLTPDLYAEQAATAKPDNQVKAYATIRFWEEVEEGNPSGSNICNIYISAADLPYFEHKHMHDFGCPSDEARAMQLENLPPGSTVELFDSPSCGKDDDWMKVTVLEQRSKINIIDFEADINYPHLHFLLVSEPPPPHWEFVPPYITIAAVQVFNGPGKANRHEVIERDSGQLPNLAPPIIDGPVQPNFIVRGPKTQKGQHKDALAGKVSCAVIDIPGPRAKAPASKTP